MIEVVYSASPVLASIRLIPKTPPHWRISEDSSNSDSHFPSLTLTEEEWDQIMGSKEDQTIPPKKSPSMLSSINSSRTSTRPGQHVQFRETGLQVGRRTGIAIPLVKRSSDGFESFEELLQYADSLMVPPRTTMNKKLSLVKSTVSKDDEGGDNVN